jgi:hypothetical protein
MMTLKTLTPLTPVFLTAFLCWQPLVPHAGAETVEKNAEPESAIQRQIETEYFQKMSDFIESDEFLKILEKEKDSARKSGMSPDFFAAGVIQGVNCYCSLNTLLRGGELRRHPLRSRWKSKDEFDAGLIRGYNIGKEHGNGIHDRILIAVQEKFSRE